MRAGAVRKDGPSRRVPTLPEAGTGPAPETDILIPRVLPTGLAPLLAFDPSATLNRVVRIA
jgi:hypothetical protein